MFFYKSFLQMPKLKKLRLSNKNEKDDKHKKELRRLRNIKYRATLKSDPSKKQRLEEIKEQSRVRARNQTVREKELREKDSKYDELSKKLWRQNKVEEKENQVKNNAIIDWTTFQKQVMRRNSVKEEAQKKRRRRERRENMLITSKLEQANKKMKTKINQLTTKLSRKRKLDDANNLSDVVIPAVKIPRRELKLKKENPIIRKLKMRARKASGGRQLERKRNIWKYRVVEFLKEENVSRVLAGQTLIDKSVYNSNRTKKCWRGKPVQKRVMKMKDAFVLLKLKFELFPYTLKTFMKWRPKYIVTAQKGAKKAKCICIMHSNIHRKMLAINKIAKQANLPDLIVENTEKLNSLTLCSKQENVEHFDAKCINRQCTNCGVEMLLDYYADLLRYHSNEVVTWTAWEYVTKKRLDKRTGEEVDKKYQEIVSHSNTLVDLIDILLSSIKPFALHIFRAKWQWHQLKNIQNNLPQGHALMIADFSENINVEFSEETIASHVSSRSITLLVVVIYRHSSDSTPENPKVLFENINILSNSMTHDSHLVHKGMELVMNYCKNRFPEQDLTDLHRYTDGCAGQFRSRHCLRDVSYCAEDFGIAMTCNFGETSEFKNITDGLGGVVKRCLKDSIIANDLVIPSNEALMSHLKNNFEFEYSPRQGEKEELDRRVFYFVNNEDVERNRPERMSKPVPGILNIRCFRVVEPGFIEMRNLSCFCSGCINRDFKNCLNQSHVVPYDLRHCRIEGKPSCCDPRNPCSITVRREKLQGATAAEEMGNDDDKSSEDVDEEISVLDCSKKGRIRFPVQRFF